jgi:hypothetical protein
VAEWRRGMELNHQIRLCRPFPFRFGFRAISHNIAIGPVNETNAQESYQFNAKPASHDPSRLIQSLPPKELIKGSGRIAALVNDSN